MSCHANEMDILRESDIIKSDRAHFGVCYRVGLDKNGVKTPVCFSEPSAYCCGSNFPYESELSTGSPPHISSGACATQKNKLAINRDKPLGLVAKLGTPLGKQIHR